MANKALSTLDGFGDQLAFDWAWVRRLTPWTGNFPFFAGMGTRAASRMVEKTSKCAASARDTVPAGIRFGHCITAGTRMAPS